MLLISETQRKEVEAALAYLAAPPDSSQAGIEAVREMVSALVTHTTTLRNFSAYQLWLGELLDMPLTPQICTMLAGVPYNESTDSVCLDDRLTVTWDKTANAFHFEISQEEGELTADTVETTCRELAGMAALCSINLNWLRVQKPSWFVPEFDIRKIVSVDGSLNSSASWKAWLSKEDAVHRFGGDVDPDYYAKMTCWWQQETLKPQKCREPVEGYLKDELLFLTDGHHRVAISHMLGHKTVPVNIQLQHQYEENEVVSNPVPRLAFTDIWREPVAEVHG